MIQSVLNQSKRHAVSKLKDSYEAMEGHPMAANYKTLAHLKCLVMHLSTFCSDLQFKE